jgi:hypothetical protein
VVDVFRDDSRANSELPDLDLEFTWQKWELSEFLKG